jgi:ABC-type branched-subunit amino acid transport system ATPase component
MGRQILCLVKITVTSYNPFCYYFAPLWFSLAVSGVAYPGELLAVMGASGAGKTTLLNTLMFRSPPSLQVSGRRTLNGVPVSSSTLASLSAYVQQHDLFIGTLTVREHLIFQVVMVSVPPVNGVAVSNFPCIKEDSL